MRIYKQINKENFIRELENNFELDKQLLLMIDSTLTHLRKYDNFGNYMVTYYTKDNVYTEVFFRNSDMSLLDILSNCGIADYTDYEIVMSENLSEDYTY